jgi:hypothetical protein
MDTSSFWKWRVALLDDNPGDTGIQGSITLLEDLGLEVLAYGGEKSTPPFLDFLYDPEHSSKVARCHLLFIDMDWQNVGLDSGEVKLPNLHDPDIPRSEKLKNFVLGINQPCSDECFPNAPIGSKFRGFWIAAALSHLCPNSLISFFSGWADILNGPIAGAFSQFLHSGIHVIHKNSTTGIDKSDFFNRIAKLQQTVLENSNEAFEWLVGRVLLPSLLGHPPLEGVTGKLWEGDNANTEWKLKAELFFPQWRDWSEKDGGCAKGLSQFVSKPAFRLSQPKERALKSIKHDLKTIMRETPLNPRSLERPIQTCFDVGSGAEGILMLIKQARESGDVSTLGQASALCDAIRENSLRQLDDLCLIYGGQFTCTEQLERKPHSKPQNEDDYRLPFDLSHLRRVIEALTDNANSPGAPQANIRLSSHWDGDYLSVEYLDNSAGFDSFNQLVNNSSDAINANKGEQKIFVDSVIKSIKERGLNRGLPLALTFPFMYPIRKLECLIIDQWYELFPQMSVEKALSQGWRFGVRWSFYMPQPIDHKEAQQ